MTANRTMGWKRPVLLLAAGCALGAGALTGCDSSSAASTAATSTSSSATSAPSSSTAGGMPATATTIMIENFTYKTPASVGPGATVRVMNMDGQAHTVTADTGNAFSVTVPAGKTATFTAPSSAGSYAFHCEYHANMHGTLVVK
jgi:plastocyanin